MSIYTTNLEQATYDIFDSDDFMDNIPDILRQFHTFAQALDSFIVVRGYEGILDDTDGKIKYLSYKFKSAQVPLPRNIGEWYTNNKKIERKTAFLICFAFKLDIEETKDFFRRICLFREFDCHIMDEVVYFFCLKNRMSYTQALTIISEIPKLKPGKINIDKTAGYTVYTKTIVNEIKKIQTIEELKSYLCENRNQFIYNNATMTFMIHKIWNEISTENGLAYKEMRTLYRPFGELEERVKPVDYIRNPRKRNDNSAWEIYLRILGLEGSFSSKYYKKRSLKSIFENNEFIHPLAQESFPDRDGLNKMINGEHVSYDRARKLLIFLVFYKFWVTRALTKGKYQAEYGDADRFLATMNNYLIDAGYQVLYLGNPYDFIIMFCVNSDEPLLTFREYMRELFMHKECTMGNEDE